MSLQNKRQPLIIILGPTAVGKTEISLRLAASLGGEIISSDSRLFYRGMDIGTAKPSPAEQARIPHHLVDVANPDQVWSLAMFLGAAHQIIADIHARGKLPFLVGGTGQYIRAIVDDWQLPEVQPDPKLRVALERWADEIGTPALYSRLMSIDPSAAARIDSLNLRRIVRALEVILSSGQLFSTQKGHGESPYEIIQLGLIRPRKELYERVDARIEQMLDKGLLEETKALLDRGYSPDLPPLSAIGYQQMIYHLNGEISLEEVVTQMKRTTRRFVRKQANWFKADDPKINWFQAGSDTAELMETKILELLNR
ncbi:MAG: tRNA (adenosine(37)-N6)-dimethylallyltransferase MiaA [Chloroflexota bacterium]